MSIGARFDQDQHADRRDAPRRMLRLAAMGQFGADRTRAVTIHNLSATGLLIETATRLSEGETFALELPEAGAREARVMWADAPHYGCRFTEELSAAALAAALLRANSPGQAADGSFGERFAHLRRERGLSLGDVAAQIGVSKPTVWAWEHGKARPIDRRLAGLAEILGVSPAALEGNAAGEHDVLDRSRRLIAETYGVAPAKVRIMIEL